MLLLADSRIGEGVQRVGLYLLCPKAPFVKPLCSQAVYPECTAVLLPITGRELCDAVRDDCLIDLGLYTQRL